MKFILITILILFTFPGISFSEEGNIDPMTKNVLVDEARLNKKLSEKYVAKYLHGHPSDSKEMVALAGKIIDSELSVRAICLFDESCLEEYSQLKGISQFDLETLPLAILRKKLSRIKLERLFEGQSFEIRNGVLDHGKH